jgi:hypothetical protein
MSLKRLLVSIERHYWSVCKQRKLLTLHCYTYRVTLLTQHPPSTMLPAGRAKEDHRRLLSTGDVWWWIVQYIEKRSYLDEDRKRAADV